MTAPFGRREAPVVDSAALGGYRLLTVLDDGGPRPLPGQFYMLSTVEHWGEDGERPYLPRAFSHARAHEDGRLDFLLEAVGPGTERLAEVRTGDRMRLVGPLGIGFRLTDGPALLVGGGIGAAPIPPPTSSASSAGPGAKPAPSGPTSPSPSPGSSSASRAVPGPIASRKNSRVPSSRARACEKARGR